MPAASGPEPAGQDPARERAGAAPHATAQAGVPCLVVRQGCRYHGDGEEQQDCKDGVAHPLGTAFVGVDIDIRHVSAGYLGVRDGRGSGGRGA